MARPPLTAVSENLFRKQLNAVFDYIEGLVGGVTSWGAITGTLADQADLNSALAGKAATSHSHAISDTTGLQAALDGKAATSHTHTASQVTDFSEAVDDRVAALLVAGANVSMTYDDAANTLTIASTGGGGSSLSPALAWVI